MNSHPAIEQAALVLSKAQNRWCALGGLTPEQVRNCIVVEVTQKGMSEIISQSVDFHRQYGRPEFGPVMVMGIRFYQVNHLPDGDDWRVLNALGTN